MHICIYKKISRKFTARTRKIYKKLFKIHTGGAKRPRARRRRAVWILFNFLLIFLVCAVNFLDIFPYIRICTIIDEQMHIYIYIYIYVYIYAYICYICIWMYICVIYIYMDIYIEREIYIYIYIYNISYLVWLHYTIYGEKEFYF